MDAHSEFACLRGYRAEWYEREQMESLQANNIMFKNEISFDISPPYLWQS